MELVVMLEEAVEGYRGRVRELEVELSVKNKELDVAREDKVAAEGKAAEAVAVQEAASQVELDQARKERDQAIQDKQAVDSVSEKERELRKAASAKNTKLEADILSLGQRLEAREEGHRLQAKAFADGERELEGQVEKLKSQIEELRTTLSEVRRQAGGAYVSAGGKVVE